MPRSSKIWRRGTGSGLTVDAFQLGADDPAVDVEAVAALGERVEHVAIVSRDRWGILDAVEGDDGAGFAVVACEWTELAVGVEAAEGEERVFVGGRGRVAEFVLGLVLSHKTIRER